MIQQMKTGYEFKIFCSNTDLDEQPLKGVVPDKWIQYTDNTQVWYASAKTRSIATVKKEIAHSDAEVLFINGIYSWTFNLAPLLFVHVPKIIVSTLGMLHPGALSQKPLKKKLYLFALKILGVSRKCSFHAATEEEKKYILQIFPESKVYVIPNFPVVFGVQPLIPKTKSRLELTSVALISPMKNHLLVVQALETCSENILYNIWGPVKEESYWQQCVEFISKLPPNIKVQYHGEAHPSQVESILSRCHVFILPSKSENFCHAIYEALSCGRPVITSHNTPWNDLLKYHAGMNVGISDELEIKKAIQLFASMDQQELATWSAGAKKYIEEALSIEEVKIKYEEMFTIGDRATR